MKYARISGAITWSQGMVVLSAGMSADDDHPLVVERPDLFTDEPPAPNLPGPGRSAAPVERATRAPGEVRKSVGRPRRESNEQ